MKTALYQYRNANLAKNENSDDFDVASAQLVLCFGAKNILQDAEVFNKFKQLFPVANIAMCSTSGEIYETEVFDDTISVAVLYFSHTPIIAKSVKIGDYENTYAAGKGLIEQFNNEGLSYLLVLSDGSMVNGSELVKGLNDVSKQKILITGGLAGDGSNFQSTLIGLNAAPENGIIAGIGFYGSSLKVGHGSQGGWDMFGLEKTVTKSKSNVLYEIDDKNALEIYKKYLGPEAQTLPGSALLFPLAITLPGSGEQVVRTILSINEDDGSMTFAGDLPVGSQVRFMKANFDKITNAAAGAALQSHAENSKPPKFALLISCVGRKLILQARVDEEVEAIDEVFDHKTFLTGFYSYGEISPILSGGGCQLHNQTMTITTFDETE